MGFALPSGSLPPRCALTAPFHPYRKRRAFTRNPGGIFSVALSVKSALSEPPRPLAGMLPCGDRTFLPRTGKPVRERPPVQQARVNCRRNPDWAAPGGGYFLGARLGRAVRIRARKTLRLFFAKVDFGAAQPHQLPRNDDNLTDRQPSTSRCRSSYSVSSFERKTKPNVRLPSMLRSEIPRPPE